MACMSILSLPIRRSISAITSSGSLVSNFRVSNFRHQFNGNFRNLKKWADSVEPVLQNHSSRNGCNLGSLRRKYGTYFRFSGRKVFGCCLVASVLYVSIRSFDMDGDSDIDGRYVYVVYSKDGQAVVVKEVVSIFIKKIWAPTFFIFTLFVGWHHPFTLAVNLVLFLMTTRPIPSSIHRFMKQGWIGRSVSHPLMREQPLFYRWLSSSYERNVDVQDYKLFRIARVEIGCRKFSVLGILDGWWVLPSWSIL